MYCNSTISYILQQRGMYPLVLALASADPTDESHRQVRDERLPGMPGYYSVDPAYHSVYPALMQFVTESLRVGERSWLVGSFRSTSWRRSASTDERRVREIEHASFTPLVTISAAGGMANEATIFYKRLPPAWPPNGTNPTPQRSLGYDALPEPLTQPFVSFFRFFWPFLYVNIAVASC